MNVIAIVKIYKTSDMILKILSKLHEPSGKIMQFERIFKHLSYWKFFFVWAFIHAYSFII